MRSKNGFFYANNFAIYLAFAMHAQKFVFILSSN